jgi:hypothetical protein
MNAIRDAPVRSRAIPLFDDPVRERASPLGQPPRPLLGVQVCHLVGKPVVAVGHLLERISGDGVG